MRRIQATFASQAENWRRLARQLELTEPTSSHRVPALITADISTQTVIREGKIAYAYRQASIRDAMKLYCNARWDKCRGDLLNLEGFDAKIMIECH
jgi:hypothetical protein